jgi:predicted nucleic acid-binding protein
LTPAPGSPRLFQPIRIISEQLLTTDYVIDETLTLLHARGERQRARVLGEKFFESSMTEVYFLTEDDIRQAWSVFHRYDDKSWSFTDCASKVVIEQMNISEAFAFDHTSGNSEASASFPAFRQTSLEGLSARAEGEPRTANAGGINAIHRFPLP